MTWKLVLSETNSLLHFRLVWSLVTKRYHAWHIYICNSLSCQFDLFTPIIHVYSFIKLEKVCPESRVKNKYFPWSFLETLSSLNKTRNKKTKSLIKYWDSSFTQHNNKSPFFFSSLHSESFPVISLSSACFVFTGADICFLTTRGIKSLCNDPISSLELK